MYQGFDQITSKDGDQQTKSVNLIADLRRNDPQSSLIGICDDLVDNLYLSLMARLSEPDSKVIMNESSKAPAGVPVLSKAQSTVNMSSVESLLGQAFQTFFRELQEYTVVCQSFKDNISLEQVSLFAAWKTGG